VRPLVRGAPAWRVARLSPRSMPPGPRPRVVPPVRGAQSPRVVPDRVGPARLPVLPRSPAPPDRLRHRRIRHRRLPSAKPARCVQKPPIAASAPTVLSPVSRRYLAQVGHIRGTSRSLRVPTKRGAPCAEGAGERWCKCGRLRHCYPYTL
jgi:hypothetical protein